VGVDHVRLVARVVRQLHVCPGCDQERRGNLAAGRHSAIALVFGEREAVRVRLGLLDEDNFGESGEYGGCRHFRHVLVHTHRDRYAEY
jgi:hypothetical protein